MQCFPAFFQSFLINFEASFIFLRLLELYQKSKHTVSLKNTKKLYYFSQKTLKPYSFCSAKAGQAQGEQENPHLPPSERPYRLT